MAVSNREARDIPPAPELDMLKLTIDMSKSPINCLYAAWESH
jgi:hypothetical protein